jgi:hypothetical protein
MPGSIAGHHPKKKGPGNHLRAPHVLQKKLYQDHPPQSFPSSTEVSTCAAALIVRL